MACDAAIDAIELLADAAEIVAKLRPDLRQHHEVRDGGRNFRNAGCGRGDERLRPSGARLGKIEQQRSVRHWRLSSRYCDAWWAGYCTRKTFVHWRARWGSGARLHTEGVALHDELFF
jgi:hypothetical protein